MKMRFIHFKKIASVSLGISVCSSLFGQSLKPESTLTTDSVQKVIPQLKVLRTLSYSKKGRAITVNRVKNLTSHIALGVEEQSHTQKNLSEIPKDDFEHLSFVVHAKIVPDKGTLVTCWDAGAAEQVQYQAWSNLDWKLIASTSTIEEDDTKYHFLLFPETSNMEGLGLQRSQIPTLGHPDIQASFLPLASSPFNPSALNFLTAVHRFYDDGKVQLKEKRVSKKKDLVLNFWNLEPSQKEAK